MPILLNDILKIAAPSAYKLHLAGRSPGGEHPLDVFVRDRQTWHNWNACRGTKNDWTRPRILSLIEYYPQPDAWLFGGVYEVIARRPDGYTLAQDPSFEKYVGRLVTRFHRYQGMRGRAFKLESYLDQFTVSELLPAVYSGEYFPGYGWVNHGFEALESIFGTGRPDWRAALEHVKGVYLIVDHSNGKKYVGSAYGEAGLWARWACYLGTGHGYNDELVALIGAQGKGYARQNFRFSVLEVMAVTTPDSVVLAREAHWKRTLLTRAFGYNRN